jgi:hypothetical protein
MCANIQVSSTKRQTQKPNFIQLHSTHHPFSYDNDYYRLTLLMIVSL